MQRIHGLIKAWGELWLLFEKRRLPGHVLTGDLLTFWRERILLSLCFINTVFGPLAILPALYFCSNDDQWPIIILDVSAYFIVVSMLYNQRLSLKIRATIICILLYSLGTLLLLKLGPGGGGYIWLFGATVFGGAMIGLRAGIIILVFNSLSFFALTAYLLIGDPAWFVPNDSFTGRWLVKAVIFLILNTIITMVTALMLRGMEAALAKEREYGRILSEKEQHYRLLADNVTDVIWTMDIERLFTYISPSISLFRGFSANVTLNQTIEQILTPASMEEVDMLIEKEWDNVINGSFGNVVIDFEFTCRDGSTVWGESKISVIYNEDNSFREILGVTRNINERRQAEAELLQSEERLRAIFEAAKNVSFVITDVSLPDMTIMEASPGAEMIFEYGRKEIVGKSVNTLHLADDTSKIREAYTRMMNSGKGISEEMTLLRKSGEHFPSLFSTYPLLTDHGRVHSVLCVCIDISDQKKLEKRIIQSEKMAALGGLVAGLVHEISTPLGVALTSASFLSDNTDNYLEKVASGEPGHALNAKYLNISRESSKMVLANINRTVELVDSFKQVAVDQAGEVRRKFNLKSYLEDIVLSLKPQIKKTVCSISVNCSGGIQLDSYPGAFYQIVSNFIMNSLIHGFNGTSDGIIDINVSVEDEEIYIDYMDNGRGIKPENIGKIFDPFFTTRRNRGGSGLGLHIVYNIVTQRLDGQISCENRSGSGAHFRIIIPKYVGMAKQQECISIAG